MSYEVRAVHRYARMGPMKARIVIDTIRGLSANRLQVSQAFACDGPMLAGGFRFRPGPQGRAMPIKKRTCHIHVHVADHAAEAAPVGGAAGAEE